VADRIADYLRTIGNPGQFDFYACLPEPLLEAAESVLTGNGVPPGQLLLEPLRG
jgi:ferredoxin-NADP reductase